MRFRKLRIAWSVVWGIAAVLFVVLWVRSYWRVDGLTARDAGRELVLFVEHGDFGASYDGLPKWSRLDLRWDSGSANPGFHMPGLAGFYYGAHPAGNRYTLLLLPLWFVALVAAIIGMLPWRRFRFTLRTLLLAMTAIAALLGLVAWSIR
jgi:hypothetical protein